MKAICHNTKMKIKIRKSWGLLNPATRVLRDKTKYNRKAKHRNKED